MFMSTLNKGFQMTFENGLTISVQFGFGNYCENRMKGSYAGELQQETTSCEDAEIAIWDSTGEWRTKEFFEDHYDDVVGRLSADEVGDLIYRVKNFEA